MRVSTLFGVVMSDGTSAEYLGGGAFCAQAVVMSNGSRIAVAISLQRSGSFTMGTLHLLAHISGRGEETVTHINREGPKVIRSANDRLGTKRRFAATQHFGRFRRKEDIDLLCRQNC